MEPVARRASRVALIIACSGVLGCGRIGFDRTPDSSPDAPPAQDGGRDGGVDAALPDAAPVTDSHLPDAGSVDAEALDGALLDAGPGATATWADAFGDVGVDRVFAAAADDAGNVYVTGVFQGTIDFGDGAHTSVGGSGDIFLASFSATGTIRWSRAFGAERTTDDDRGYGLFVDGGGDVYLAGRFGDREDFGGGYRVSQGGTDAVVIRFTTDGAHRWSRSFGGSGSEAALSVAANSAGEYCVGAIYSADFTLDGFPVTAGAGGDALLACFDAMGARRWHVMVNGAGANEIGWGLGFDAAGNVYWAGALNGTVDFGDGPRSSESKDIFLASYTWEGAYRWDRVLGGSMVDEGARLQVDTAGNVYLAGSYRAGTDLGGGVLPSFGDFDSFVASFDADGTHRWSRGFGDVAIDTATDVALDAAGNVFVTGWARGTVDFGGGPRSGPGEDDIFVASFTGAGAPRWSRMLGSPGQDQGWGVAWGGDRLVLGGFFGDAADVDGILTPHAGSYDLAVMTLRQ